MFEHAKLRRAGNTLTATNASGAFTILGVTEIDADILYPDDLSLFDGDTGDTMPARRKLVMTLVVIRITSNPPLQGWIRRWCVDINDGTYVADLSTRVREGILSHLHANTPPGHYTAVWPTPGNPQGWDTQSNNPNPRTDVLHNLRLTVQR